MKEELKKKAIALRIKGNSVKQVSAKLGISWSTASLWLREIKLSKEAKEKLKKRSDEARARGCVTNRRKKIDRLDAINNRVVEEIDRIDLSESSNKLLCAMIYYCEGAKNDSAVYFANSDPQLLKLFLSLLRSNFKLDESKFKVIVHIHEYHNWPKQLNYWSRVLKISKKYFFRPYLKAHTGKNKKEGYPGCVSVRYYDSNVSRELLAYAKQYFQINMRD